VPPGRDTASFVKLAERSSDLFCGSDASEVEDVRKALLQVRQQYDRVHNEAEIKEAKLRALKEQNGKSERLQGQKGEEMTYLSEKSKAFKEQYEETQKLIKDMHTSRKVYLHMLARIQKEQAVFKQKMLMMTDTLEKKRAATTRKGADAERMNTRKVQKILAMQALEDDAAHEREACRIAREQMDGEMAMRREVNRRKAKFESWRHEIALEAANEAFTAAAGRLRKIFAIEKLAGNCLQKTTFEQIERSQHTEDGFQRIRDVTGLGDVMDIVHKFLNRDVEHEQLKGSVKDAEVRLENLRQDLEVLKRETEGITFEHRGSEGGIYKDTEHAEQELHDAMHQHEVARDRLSKITLETEHMKRWAVRMGQMMSAFEDMAKADHGDNLPGFFKKLEVAIERFLERMRVQIKDGKLGRKALMHMANKEHHRQNRLLNDQDFLYNNCRVPAAADVPRGQSRQGGGAGANANANANANEDDPTSTFMDDRERIRAESEEVVRQAQQEQQKRSRPKG